MMSVLSGMSGTDDKSKDITVLIHIKCNKEWQLPNCFSTCTL